MSVYGFNISQKEHLDYIPDWTTVIIDRIPRELEKEKDVECTRKLHEIIKIKLTRIFCVIFY